MSLLNNMSVKSKLTLILLFPIIGLIVFASLKSYDYYEKYNSMNKIESLTILSQKISRLVHETQKERGMTAGYIGSKGAKFKDKLPSQRELSNEQYEAFKSFVENIDFSLYPRVFKENIDNTILKFEGLSNIRPNVDNLNIAIGDALAYYTNMNAVILSNVKLIAKLSSDAKISREITAYANFLLSKERAGIERAVGTNTLGRGSFADGMKTKFTNLITAQNVYMDNFLDLANNESIDFYKKTMVGKEIDEVKRIRAMLLSSTDYTDSAEYWFSQITGKINKLKEVDNRLSEILLSNVSKIKQSVYTSLIFVLLGSIASLLFATVIGFLISKKITYSLNNFTKGLDNFFEFLNYKVNDVELLESKSKDEFGQMANIVNINIQKTKENILMDRKLIDETISVSDKICKGYLNNKISSVSSNPSLNELKDIINDTNKTLNNNLENIKEVLVSYRNANYLPVVDKNGMEGVVEELIDGINILGETITQDLITGKRNGLILGNSANVLLENVNNITKSSNEAAASLEETAAALEEITSTIISNSDNVVQMSNYASNVIDSANSGQELATNTMTAMDEINEQVTSINEAITVIDQIAFQTNILSLNAAVEAATAGEAGKGFAVVAQEVRNLASRSAEAAKEIKDIVETATMKANKGKEITKNMLDGYIELNSGIEKTIDLIKDVEAASNEQKVGIEQINDSVTKLDQQTQTNAAAAYETNEIAISTQKLSKSIIDAVNIKEFRGKDTVTDRRKSIRDLSYNGVERRGAELEIKKMKAHEIQNLKEKTYNRAPESRINEKPINKKINIESKNDDTEWESF